MKNILKRILPLAVKVIIKNALNATRETISVILSKVLLWMNRGSSFIEDPLDKTYLHHDVPMSDIVRHDRWQNYIAREYNKEGIKILEIGSREITSKSRSKTDFINAQYVGFDIHAGSNVDIVGDAHKLSSYFPDGHKFDLIYTSACFEHFAMPWVVAMEIAKMLKIGGTVFVETHFSFSSHERPWHFFQFSDMALRVLFSEAMGFECIEAGVSNPIVGRFSSLAVPYLRNKPVSGLYCHSEYLGKKIRDVQDFSWEKYSLDKFLGDTEYPAGCMNTEEK